TPFVVTRSRFRTEKGPGQPPRPPPSREHALSDRGLLLAAGTAAYRQADFRPVQSPPLHILDRVVGDTSLLARRVAALAARLPARGLRYPRHARGSTRRARHPKHAPPVKRLRPSCYPSLVAGL